MLSVLSAILRPSPSRPIRFSTGTRTWWNRVTPFSRPLRPMNWLRFSTVMPSESVSTTNAVMPPLPPSCGGTWAITTTSSATTPLVVHSLTPSRMYAAPSSVGTAVLSSRAGSEPTSGSVSRNAVTAPCGAARQERLLLLLGAERLDRLGHADRLVRRQQRADGRVDGAGEHQRLAVVGHGEAEPAVLLGTFIPNDADLGQRGHVLVAERGLALDRRGRRCVSQTSRSLARNASPRSTSSASARGCGWIRSRSNRPR